MAGAIISPCNFREAGRISNEHARILVEIHEVLAHRLVVELEAYFRTEVELKLVKIEQVPVREYIATIAADSYLASCALDVPGGSMLIEFQQELVHPIIDILLGGSGEKGDHHQDCSEIEEELMSHLMSFLADKTGEVWKLPESRIIGTQRSKATGLHHSYLPNERVVMVVFQMEMAETSGRFQLVLSAPLVNALIKQNKRESSSKISRVRGIPPADLRERVLDCAFTLSVVLPDIRVPVADIVSLRPGAVINLRTPVRESARLMVQECELFESSPVRSGLQKAAQLGRKIMTATAVRD